MRRRVLLHMGLGKTGSTALQVGFVRNRDRLAAHGVHYPAHASDRRAAAGRSVNGNGEALLPFLAPREGDTDIDAEQALQDVLAEVRGTSAPTVLYSSEFLARFRDDRLIELRDELAALDVDLWAFLYVRDIAGLAVSGYAQIVKRRRYRGSMSEYVRTHQLGLPSPTGVAGHLSSLHDVLTPAHVVVRHYDTDRAHLFEEVATNVLTIDDLEGFDLVRAPVNRSLTPIELEWMRYLNASSSDDSSGLAVDRFTHREPLDTQPHAVLRSDLDLLRERFQADVDWINAHAGLPTTLSVEGSIPVVNENELPEITDRERFLLDVIADATRSQAERQQARRAQRAAAAPSVLTTPDRGRRARAVRLVRQVRDRIGRRR